MTGPGEFDIPANRVLPVDNIAIRLNEAPHPYELENAQAIKSSWARESAKNPALFDGEVIMLRSLHYRDSQIEGTCHPIRFSTFLHWRADAFAGAGFHVFASAMPVTADGALVAVRMGPHTANAGRVYFAAGSFERIDFRDGLVDLPANMHREVAEETGIDLERASRDPAYYALRSESGLTLVRRYFLNLNAEDTLAAVHRHITNDTDPEIDDVIAIYGENDVPESAPPHMLPLVRWHFSSS